jgi:hypothetical protein
MSFDEKVIARIKSLIDTAFYISKGDIDGDLEDKKQKNECVAWLVSALNIAVQICPVDSPYLKHIKSVCEEEHGWLVHDAVGQVSSVLNSLLIDAEAGLISTVMNQAMALTFDNFLDHAEYYASAKKKKEAGVISGVVFEDTIRRICDMSQIKQKNVNLEDLINALMKIGVFNALKAKRAKASAHVRTKATHAQWDEFQIEDVNATIQFCRELIEQQLA